MSSRRISISVSRFGWLPIRISTISSKLSSQNGRFMLSGVMTSAHSLERLRIFAVDIEQQDMGLRVLLENAPQDQRHRAGFAGAGGAEHGEMLAEQLVDLDHRRDRGVLLDMADADGGVGVAGIGLGELVLAGPEHDIAERGIGRDAAPEAFGRPVLVLRQFADELDLDDPQLLVVLRMRRHGRAQRRDQRERDRRLRCRP